MSEATRIALAVGGPSSEMDGGTLTALEAEIEMAEGDRLNALEEHVLAIPTRVGRFALLAKVLVRQFELRQRQYYTRGVGV